MKTNAARLGAVATLLVISAGTIEPGSHAERGSDGYRSDSGGELDDQRSNRGRGRFELFQPRHANPLLCR